MAAMALDKSIIGRSSAPLVAEVETGHIRRFCDAIGELNPIYRDEAAARAAGHPRLPAPPTFPIALRPHDVREGLGIDMKQVLHGEQEIEYRRPLYAGDVVELVQRIADCYEKQGKSGAMDFLVLETTATDAQGEIVYVSRSNIVVRR
jgi:acyl dehydratase